VKQVTIRIMDEDLEESLARVVRQQKTSTEAAALFLLRRGAGLGERQNHAGAMGSSSDRFVGSWEVEPEQILLTGADGTG
jgi:hypothetical protein